MRLFAYSRSWFTRLCVAVLATGCAATAPVAQTERSNEYVVSEQDPPGRVGHISLTSGSVSLTDLRSGETETASVNWPVTSAMRLATGRGGHTEVRIGSIALRLDDDTLLDFNRVDDETVQLFLHQGSVAVRLRSREMLRELEFVTPRERIVFDDVGRYRIDVDRGATQTAVTAWVGHARMLRGYHSYPVHSGYRGELNDSPNTPLVLVHPAIDVFDDWVAKRDARDDASRSVQHASREVSGIENLDEYGNWDHAPQYGAIWIPSQVAPGWAPYRYGRWVWVAPWGWTWLDDAPWGFAPFHYGRWVIYNGRWCWAPGRWVARPYYAPALVVWVSQPGLSLSISTGQPVGWFPLGWGEPYYPPHHHSPRYIRSININHVHNINNVTVINPPSRYTHQQHPDRVSWAPVHALPRRERIQDVMSGQAPETLLRAAPNPRPPLPTHNGALKRSAPAAPGSGPIRVPGRVPQPRQDTTEPPSTPLQTLPPPKTTARPIERIQIERVAPPPLPKTQATPTVEPVAPQPPGRIKHQQAVPTPQDAVPPQSPAERGKFGGR